MTPLFRYEDRKNSEDLLRSSLAEKEVSIKEMHHRVKNNLQVISSLLYLQNGKIDNEDARNILRDTRSRVRSMALVPEKLYQSKDLARIDFHDYARSLVADLFNAHGPSIKKSGPI